MFKLSSISRFNPRSPRGERPLTLQFRGFAAKFQSPFPSRGTTGIAVDLYKLSHVSIPVPLAGNDERDIKVELFSCVSIPVPLAGNDLISWVGIYSITVSIPVPLAGNDAVCNESVDYTAVSIPVPLAGNDCPGREAGTGNRSFNPRSPRGERRYDDCLYSTLDVFQSPFPSRGTTAIFDRIPPLFLANMLLLWLFFNKDTQSILYIICASRVERRNYK